MLTDARQTTLKRNQELNQIEIVKIMKQKEKEKEKEKEFLDEKKEGCWKVG
jgi:hypothetical protein